MPRNAQALPGSQPDDCTGAIYDQLAEGYAEGFFSNVIATSARSRARSLYAKWIHGGDRIADLGCGPGIDTIWLAERGSSVAAVDCSPAMIELLSKLLQGHPKRSHVQAHVGDIFVPEGVLSGLGCFDSIVLGFGVLNYARDLGTALEVLAGHLAPEGILVASVLTRRSVWDLLWHLAVLHRRAPRWTRKPTRFTLGEASTLERHWVLEDFRHALPNGLHIVHWEAMGHVAPPPYLDRKLERFPTLRNIALRFDYLTRRSWAARWGADVLWVVIQHRPPHRGARPAENFAGTSWARAWSGRLRAGGSSP